ncbi:hypothetical protein TWF506_002074 [Arthrobotrys conoides]|uniref:Uncharacterized protein n=1 Tax=Arthrobotrys conoides TaxID=74498 RepID=A0AAN8PAQ9_9PEZI
MRAQGPSGTKEPHSFGETPRLLGVGILRIFLLMSVRKQKMQANITFLGMERSLEDQSKVNVRAPRKLSKLLPLLATRTDGLVKDNTLKSLIVGGESFRTKDW